MLGHYILDGHEPVQCDDPGEWADKFDTTDRQVAYTLVHVGDHVEDPIGVSTVFLGIDHGFGQPGLPVLFETMVFGGLLDGYSQRWTTWEEAQVMHNKIVKTVRREHGLPEEEPVPDVVVPPVQAVDRSEEVHQIIDLLME